MTEHDGEFIVTMRGKELFRSSQSKKAVKRFNELKKSVETQFPVHDLSPEEKAAILQRAIADGLIKHNSLKPDPGKKSAARGTRTFG